MWIHAVSLFSAVSLLCINGVNAIWRFPISGGQKPGNARGGDLPLREGLVDISLSPSVKIAQRFCANKVLKANNFFIKGAQKMPRAIHGLLLGTVMGIAAGLGVSPVLAEPEDSAERLAARIAWGLERLKNGNSCNRCYFNGIVLRGHTLYRTSLKMVEMRDADLRWTYFEDVDLFQADLRGSDMRQASLENTNLYDADLRTTDLDKANLRGADLTSANLQRAYLTEAILSGATLREARLDDADLTGADLTFADLSRGILTRANFTEANLENAILSYSILGGADFSGANLTGTRFRGVDFSNANLTDTDLSKSKLSATDLEQAILCRTLTPWGEDNSGC